MNYLALALAVKLWETPSGVMVGDGGRSVGEYQIQEIAVDEINRVCNTHYSYADRVKKGREMFITYAKYLHEVKGYDQAQIYQIWNAGNDAVKKGQSVCRGLCVYAMYNYIDNGQMGKAMRIAKERRIV